MTGVCYRSETEESASLIRERLSTALEEMDALAELLEAGE